MNEAKKLEYGNIIYHKKCKNADETPRRYRVNGKVKLWKRNLKRIKVPLKRGLWEYGYLTEDNLKEFTLKGVN